jgi:hypothetical protein
MHNYLQDATGVRYFWQHKKRLFVKNIEKIRENRKKMSFRTIYTKMVFIKNI